MKHYTSETKSRTQQAIEDHGNLTERKDYTFYTGAGTPSLVRTYTYTYLTGANYSSRHIWNRPLTVTVQKPGGSVITLVSNTYDVYALGMGNVSDPSQLRQHDTANYGGTFTYRGNMTRSVTLTADMGMEYYLTGALLRATNAGTGQVTTQIPDSTKNYAVPSSVTASSLATSFTWNSGNQMTSATGPNSATTLASYDSYLRPSGRTLPNGSGVSYTYGANWNLATSGTTWTKTWVDGFGRATKVESGYNTGSTPTTVLIVETKYAPCACTPIGKLWKTSLPYAPGTAAGSIRWTEHVYDALGRTVQVKQPVNPTTSVPWGVTSYAYAGPTVTVTDPAGKWKKFENDAQGNLIKVTEPRPGGGTNYETTYTYSAEFGQLLTSTMTRPGMGTGNGATVTQTRTWTYNANQRLSSVTHPESGTTSFLYNAFGAVREKTDAKGQRSVSEFDANGRVTATRRYTTALSTSEDTCARVDYYYDSQTFDASFTSNATGRLAAKATGCDVGAAGPGRIIEMYSYTAGGAVTKKRMRIVRNSTSVNYDLNYSYGSDGKLATVLYPGYTVPFTYTYDLMNRPTKMTGPVNYWETKVIDHAKDVAYNTLGQVTSMTYLTTITEDVDSMGNPVYYPNYTGETKTYNDLGQLIRQQATGTDIEYFFSGTANNGRITGRRNNISGEDVVYPKSGGWVRRSACILAEGVETERDARGEAEGDRSPDG